MGINNIDSVHDVSTNLDAMNPGIKHIRGGRPYVVINRENGARLNRLPIVIAADGFSVTTPRPRSAE